MVYDLEFDLMASESDDEECVGCEYYHPTSQFYQNHGTCEMNYFIECVREHKGE